MPKKAKTPGQPMHEIIAIRALPQFKEEVIQLAAQAGYTHFSDYIRDAILTKNATTKEQHA